MFRGIFSKKAASLTGAPAVRRLKTYSAQSGYVYQYYYEGQRPFHQAEDSGTEYVFSVSPDRKKWRQTSVLLSDLAIRDWQLRHARDLSSTERYAVCKIALFHAFDERPAPEQMKAEIRVRSADVEGIIDSLGL